MQNPNGPKTADVSSAASSTPVAIEKKLSQWFPELSSVTVTGLALYQSEFLIANKSLDLIPASGLKNLAAMYFADSVLASRLIRKALVPGQALYDAGGAGGFPGIIFSILFPEQKVILLERDAKRADFYKRAASKLKAGQFSVLSQGVDELPEQSVANLVIRGSLPLGKTLLACRKQMAQGARLFHMKTDSWTSELSGLPSQLFSVWRPSLLGQYRVPETSSDMAVVLTEKISN